MGLATVYSRARDGLAAPLVSVEVHIANGLPGFSLVGLPEAAVRESKDRVRAAILNSGFTFPSRRITVNLAPADLPKDGGRFDLPIAIGILVASGEIRVEALDAQEFLGELSLSGKLRPVIGALSAALACADASRALVLPAENAEEGGRVADAEIYAATDLLAVCAHISGQQRLSAVQPVTEVYQSRDLPDLSEVRGQQQAKRALEIAASGGHHLLFIGPPGSGKSMLASRATGILPFLSDREALEVAAIHSLSIGGAAKRDWQQRPYRAPHHTSSAVALAGGGGQPRPGEISLAHKGVLFLDELPEFSRHSLEVLREPMESAEITISRAARQAVFPADFQLLAAMNPCPCGWWGDRSGRCACTQEQVARYNAKISGPLLDRIDLQLYVRPVAREQLSLTCEQSEESSQAVQARVCKARRRQEERQGKLNGRLLPGELQAVANTSREAQLLADQAMEKMQLSARGYHRVLKVARTIADLADRAEIAVEHISEAMQYRQLDRQKQA